jgi:Na+-transporting methylmalonyl-CoA/oxaloacetate decarboxylase beta subunit
MNKPKLSELSNETLLKNEKILKASTYALAAVLVISFVVNIYVAVTKKFSALSVIPIAFLPILIINLNSLKEIKKEIKSRGL